VRKCLVTPGRIETRARDILAGGGSVEGEALSAKVTRDTGGWGRCTRPGSWGRVAESGGAGGRGGMVEVVRVVVPV
jgi:hypothetical protein